MHFSLYICIHIHTCMYIYMHKFTHTTYMYICVCITICFLLLCIRVHHAYSGIAAGIATMLAEATALETVAAEMAQSEDAPAAEFAQVMPGTMAARVSKKKTKRHEIRIPDNLSYLFLQFV